MKKVLYLFVIIFYFGFSSLSQGQDYKFRHYFSSDGLSSSFIYKINQDSMGYIWVGTFDGLNRFDGYNFKVYRKDPEDTNSISSNFITNIFNDSRGKLWICTTKGLNLYEPSFDGFRHFLPVVEDENLIGVNFIFEDSEGTIWVKARDGYNILDKERQKLKLFKPDGQGKLWNTSDVETIIEKEKGIYWVLKAGKLYAYKKGESELSEIKVKGYERDKNIESILIDKSRRIWAKVENGFLIFDNDSVNFIKDKADNVYPDNFGNVWSVGTNYGFGKFDESKNSFQIEGKERVKDVPLSEQVSDSSTFVVFVDKAKGLWVGSYRGLNYSSANRKKFSSLFYDRNSFSNFLTAECLSLSADDSGNIFLGTVKGLNKYKVNDRKMEVYLPSSKNKFSISSDKIHQTFCRDHYIFLNTEKGLNILDKKKNIFINRNNYKSIPTLDSFFKLIFDSIYYSALGKFYIDSESKNFFYNPKKGSLIWYNKDLNRRIAFNHDPHNPKSFKNKQIIVQYKDGKNLYVIEDSQGIAILNLESNEVAHYGFDIKDTGSLSNLLVHCLYKDKKGRLWVGTEGGLDLLGNNGKFTHFRKKNGLYNDFIKSIGEDKNGNIWVSTNGGIARINPESGFIVNFNIWDGLPGNEYNSDAYAEDQNGYLYFSGSNGVVWFHPDSIKRNLNHPNVVLTNLYVYNDKILPGKNSPLKESISVAKEIVLSHTMSTFTIDFVGLDFTAPNKNMYGYFLEGYDKEWNMIGYKRSAVYTNLEPGEYVFKVKASNNDRLWNENYRSIRIIITPPYYKTWWFKLLLSFVFIGLIFGTFKVRTRAIKHRNRLLEQQVKERTSQLEESNKKLGSLNQNLGKINQELEVASKVAEEAKGEAIRANHAKSEFLANMSHEIRTPMNGVIGMTELLMNSKLSGEQKEFVETIKNSGESLLYIINNILDFSKIESGKMDVDNHSFDLNQCIEEALDLFAHKAGEKGIDLICLVENNVPSYITGDSIKIKQILINLVGNAIKFTTKGEIFVKVTIKDEFIQNIKNGESFKLDFLVRDTGIGIPKEKQSKLFQSFTQVDSSTTRKYGGTGLGLAISYKLVQLMGGEIKLESEEGKGTDFIFSIRATLASDYDKEIHNKNVVDLEGKKILVVDDNRTNREILKYQLEQFKIDVVLVDSGQAALQTLKINHSFDLIISDMQMPEMDGVGLGKEIKKDYPAIPIICLSSIGNDLNNDKTAKQIFQRILSKPVKQRSLIEAILKGVNIKYEVKGENESNENILTSDFAVKYPLEILVAEDNPTNQKLAHFILSKLGYKADFAVNGIEVLEKVKDKKFDLILMDVQMPEMDGLEATQEICKIYPKEQRPFIIAVTANAMQEDKEICLNAGMNAYLSKPFKMEDLIKAFKGVQPLNL